MSKVRRKAPRFNMKLNSQTQPGNLPADRFLYVNLTDISPLRTIRENTAGNKSMG